MRFIEFNGKTPVNTPPDLNVPDWAPWTEQQWQVWLTVSDQLRHNLEQLNGAGDTAARNRFIDQHAKHWGELKPWLKALSKGKCWFSEVRELYSHYDVEHFRPKKQAKNLNKTVRDGYWWLAFDYTNLRLCANVGNRKKGGWFPLKRDSICSTFEHQCEEMEVAYLLDPIDEADVNLIAFDETGNAIPSPGASPWERLRAEQTIERLKLNAHIDLAEARRKVWQKVCSEIELYQRAKARCDDGRNPAARQTMNKHCLNIKKLTSCEAELSTVAKWCVFLRKDPQLCRLVA